MKQKILSVLLIIILLVSMVPIQVSAAEGTLRYVANNNSGAPIEKTHTYTQLSSGSQNLTWSTNGAWYYVTGNVVINGSISITKVSNLLIADGASLTVNGGISIDGNFQTLTVYGQTNQTGTLTVNNPSGAGISGGTGTNLIIESGRVISNGIGVEKVHLDGGTVTSVGNGGISAEQINVNNGAVVKASALSGGQTYNAGIVLTGVDKAHADDFKLSGNSLAGDYVIPKGATLNITRNATLVIPAGVTLTNNGTITNGGTITNNGTIANRGTVPSNIGGNAVVAAPTVNLTIGGIAMGLGEYLPSGAVATQTSAPSSSYAYFHENGTTLTLSNFTGASQKTIIADNDLNIVLSGTNTLDAGHMNYNAGINVSGDLTIGGQGSLQIVGAINGASTKYASIYGENVTFRDGAIVSAAGQHIGVCAANTVTVDGGCKVTADGAQSASAQGFAVWASKTDVKNGTLIMVTNGIDGNDRLCNGASTLTGYRYYRTTGNYIEGTYTGAADSVKYLELTTVLPISDPIVVGGVSLDRGQYLEQGKTSPINGTPSVERYVWYDPNAPEPTLVMHNFSLSVSGTTSYAVATTDDKLVLRLEGSNSLSSSGGMSVRVMRTNPYSSGSLTVTGNGSLSLTESGTGGYAIYANSGITFKGGAQVTVSAPNSYCMQNVDLRIEDMGTRLISKGNGCILSTNSNAYVTLPRNYEYRTSANGNMINSEQTPFTPDGNIKYAEILVLHSHDWSDTWSGNGTHHWHECSAAGCDIVNDQDKDGYAKHTGGTASCTDKAGCEHCQAPYGEELAHSYTVPRNDADFHWNKCAGCDATDARAAHNTEDDGDCTTAVKCSCGYTVTEARASHTGGTASCTDKASCSVCGTAYGDLDADNHSKEAFVYTSNADGTAHTKKYECCNATTVADEAHEYGEDGKCACGAADPSSDTQAGASEKAADGGDVQTGKGCSSTVGAGASALLTMLTVLAVLSRKKKRT